jgi:erythromycin esterase
MQFYSLFYKIYIVGTNSMMEKDIENFHRLERSKDLDILLDRIGDSQFVLLGEASHGTSEFYRWRTEITKRLINEKGFSLWI